MKSDVKVSLTDCSSPDDILTIEYTDLVTGEESNFKVVNKEDKLSVYKNDLLYCRFTMGEEIGPMKFVSIFPRSGFVIEYENEKGEMDYIEMLSEFRFFTVENVRINLDTERRK